MICETCADYIAGKCESPDKITRELFPVYRPGELTTCDVYREAEERPQEEPAEEMEALVRDMMERLGESEGWEDPDPDQLIIARAEDAAKAFKGGPKFARETACDTLTAEGMKARGIIHDLLKKCPEFENARGQKYRLTWRLSKWTKKGRSINGSSGPISEKNRETYGIEESWEITLNLAKWMLFDEGQRERLIHHELMHVVRSDHAVQEFPETVQRYGCHHKEQAQLVIAAITRPDFIETVERWGLGNAGQVLLPWGGGTATVEVKVRQKVGGAAPEEPTPERAGRAHRSAEVEKAL